MWAMQARNALSEGCDCGFLASPFQVVGRELGKGVLMYLRLLAAMIIFIIRVWPSWTARIVDDGKWSRRPLWKQLKWPDSIFHKTYLPQ